jgi:hypothetical protein
VFGCSSSLRLSLRAHLLLSLLLSLLLASIYIKSIGYYIPYLDDMEAVPNLSDLLGRTDIYQRRLLGSNYNSAVSGVW